MAGPRVGKLGVWLVRQCEPAILLKSRPAYSDLGRRKQYPISRIYSLRHDKGAGTNLTKFRDFISRSKSSGDLVTLDLCVRQRTFHCQRIPHSCSDFPSPLCLASTTYDSRRRTSSWLFFASRVPDPSHNHRALSFLPSPVSVTHMSR
jgi:hypothetical protein